MKSPIKMGRISGIAAAMTLALFTASPALAVTINDSLTTNDFLATDSIGTFYYDVFEVSTTSTDDIIVSMNSNDFSAWTIWWDFQPLPADFWEDGAGTDLYADAAGFGTNPGIVGAATTFTILNPVVGQIYQIAAATNDYNPTALGDYTFEVTGTDVSVSQLAAVVPLPATLWLLLAGALLCRQRIPKGT